MVQYGGETAVYEEVSVIYRGQKLISLASFLALGRRFWVGVRELWAQIRRRKYCFLKENTQRHGRTQVKHGRL